MKKIFLFTLFFLPFILVAQSYVITYNEYFSHSDGDISALKESIESTSADSKDRPVITLLYKDGEAFYGYSDQHYTEDNEEKSTENNKASNQVSTCNYYKNQKKNVLLKNYFNYIPSLYGEDILIHGDLPKYNWEITDTKATISGYPCTLAKTVEEDGTQVLAWYTDDISINEGPRGYWGLPGLILQVQINDKVLIAAKSIKKTKEDIKITRPTKGNKMTKEEFTQLTKELFKPRTITTPDGQSMIISNQ